MLKNFISAITPEFTVKMSRDELQAKVSGKFPLTVDRSGASIRLHSPLVILTASDEYIGLDMAVDTKVPFIGTKAGTIKTKVTINLDKEKRVIYVSNVDVVDLRVDGAPAMIESAIRDLVGKVAAIKLKDYAIYNIDDKLITKMLTSVKVEDGQLILKFGV